MLMSLWYFFFRICIVDFFVLRQRHARHTQFQSVHSAQGMPEAFHGAPESSHRRSRPSIFERIASRLDASRSEVQWQSIRSTDVALDQLMWHQVNWRGIGSIDVTSDQLMSHQWCGIISTDVASDQLMKHQINWCGIRLTLVWHQIKWCAIGSFDVASNQSMWHQINWCGIRSTDVASDQLMWHRIN